jgi:hypothetical protein
MYAPAIVPHPRCSACRPASSKLWQGRRWMSCVTLTFQLAPVLPQEQFQHQGDNEAAQDNTPRKHTQNSLPGPWVQSPACELAPPSGGVL